MQDVRLNIGKNITVLRREAGLTQYEVAEKLNYSDKAVSKWERGESVPDITVLVDIADLFNVSLDYLVRGEDARVLKARPHYNRKIIVGLSVGLVWLLALAAFIVLPIAIPGGVTAWLAFLYAVPVSAVVCIVFNTVWFNLRYNYFFISLLMWSALVSAYLTVFSFGMNFWQLYLLGVPGQFIIVMWSLLKSNKKDDNHKLHK